MAVIVAICVIYVVLGTAMEELSMILLTVPLFFPMVVGLGYDPVWFGIIIVIVVQIGLISPPVGHEHLRREDMLPRISTATVFRGVTPFIFAESRCSRSWSRFPGSAWLLPEVDEALTSSGSGPSAPVCQHVQTRLRIDVGIPLVSSAASSRRHWPHRIEIPCQH